MKKLVKVLALAVLMIMGGQAIAQTRGAFFLSASFPMKDFADFDGFDEFALTSLNADDDDAGAGIGFNAGLKGFYNVGVKGLGVMLSLDGFYNGPNADLKTAYRNKEGEAFGGSLTYKAKPGYINIPLMLGLNYIYHFNPNFGIYAEAGAGANFRIITNMETVGKVAVGEMETTTTTIQKYDKAFSFAWQAGIGFEIAKNLVIGCSFYDLGKAPVKGDQTIKIKTYDNTPIETKTNYQEMGTVHPMMILARIGFSF